MEVIGRHEYASASGLRLGIPDFKSGHFQGDVRCFYIDGSSTLTFGFTDLRVVVVPLAWHVVDIAVLRDVALDFTVA